jgi:DNA-binding transcriptional regulator YhcF (GntR family)
MDFVVNRKGGVPVRDQLVTQLELKILGGELTHGQRLPSVRSLARRLRVHHNTVSAAYQDLQDSGHVELKRGSGVFVRHAGPQALPEARGLDEMIRMALHTALRQGHTGAQVRAAVERWLAAVPPDRIVVVDPSREMAELLVHELKQGLGIEADCTTPEQVAAQPSLLSGALVLVLPYHVEAIRRLVPSAAIEQVTIEAPEAERQAVLALPPGSIVLVVSHSPTVLPFASVFLRSLRGHEIVVETKLLAAPREWKRLVKAADLVVADALSLETVRRSGPKRLREVRVVSDAALARLKDSLTVVVPQGPVKGAVAAGGAQGKRSGRSART